MRASTAPNSAGLPQHAAPLHARGTEGESGPGRPARHYRPFFPASVALAVCGLGGLGSVAVVVRRIRRQTRYIPVWDDWLWYAIWSLDRSRGRMQQERHQDNQRQRHPQENKEPKVSIVAPGCPERLDAHPGAHELKGESSQQENQDSIGERAGTFMHQGDSAAGGRASPRRR